MQRGDADLEEDDLDLVYLEVGGSGVVRLPGAVDVVLRVALVAAVRDGAAPTARRRQRRRRRHRRRRLATLDAASCCCCCCRLVTARSGGAHHSLTDLARVHLHVVLRHVNLHVHKSLPILIHNAYHKVPISR